ncbi:hypothetical protein chiPu_0013217 [Chiloscyllium punctatum]|uniref:Uncharacterized protein n=1 Tax=Chiloscyllium punctatum TaxID=137246 RepID=A0A401SWI5_CHIPU|nr:hypothetical protein [Chiloscyllium punctatum]
MGDIEILKVTVCTKVSSPVLSFLGNREVWRQLFVLNVLVSHAACAHAVDFPMSLDKAVSPCVLLSWLLPKISRKKILVAVVNRQHFACR